MPQNFTETTHNVEPIFADQKSQTGLFVGTVWASSAAL